MRKVSINCDACGSRIPLERAKEALIEEGRNDYFLLDLCAQCLDGHLQDAATVNDTQGFRQTAAVLIRPSASSTPTTTG